MTIILSLSLYFEWNVFADDTRQGPNIARVLHEPKRVARLTDVCTVFLIQITKTIAVILRRVFFRVLFQTSVFVCLLLS